MKPNIMILVVVAVVAFLGVPRFCSMQESRESDARSAQDDALWNKVPESAQAFQSAPPDWIDDEHRAGGVKFSAPCEFEESMEKSEGMELPLFVCRSGDIGYGLVVAAYELESPKEMQKFWMGHDSGFLDSIRKNHPDARLIPDKRIKFDGFAGRQFRVESSDVQMMARVVSGRRTSVTMFVVGQNPPENAEQFFNALKLAGPAVQ
jgi:hypothetical protein